MSVQVSLQRLTEAQAKVIDKLTTLTESIADEFVQTVRSNNFALVKDASGVTLVEGSVDIADLQMMLDSLLPEEFHSTIKLSVKRSGGKSKVFNDQFQQYGAIFLFFAKNVKGTVHYKLLKQNITTEVRSAGVITFAGAAGVVMYCAEATNWPLFIAKLAATAVIAKSVGDTIDVLTREQSHLSNELVFISDCIRKGHLVLNDDRDVVLTICTD